MASRWWWSPRTGYDGNALTKKFLTALGVLSALLVGAFLLGSLRWHSLRQAGPPRLEEVAWGAGPRQNRRRLSRVR